MKNLVSLIILIYASCFSVAGQSLQEYFIEAAENNPGIEAKYKSFEAAMHRVDQVASLPDMNLSFGYFISPVETRVGPQRARFSLTQMFPWFGTLKAQQDATTLLAEARYQEFIDARNNLYAQVAAAYYPIVEHNLLINLEDENLDLLNSYKEVSNVKYRNGSTSMVDVLRVDIMVNDAVTNLAILNKKRNALESQLRSILNRKDSSQIQIEDQLIITNLPQVIAQDSLLASNPKLTELDLMIKASEAREQLAIKQGLPKIGVGVDYVIIGERTDVTVPDNGKDVLMPMVSLSLPIFRGKYKAAQKEAGVMQEVYRLQKQELGNQLKGAYDLSWFEIEKQQVLIKLYEQQASESRQSLNLLFKSYANSGSDFEEVLRMQQQVLKYEKLNLSARTQYKIAIANFDYLIGNIQPVAAEQN